MTPRWIADRLDTIVLARIAATPAWTSESLYQAASRFGPFLADSDIAEAQKRLRDRELVADRAPTERGKSQVRELLAGTADWSKVASMALPAHALGWRWDDKRVRARLKKREMWAAAIVARDYGLLAEGVGPPSASDVADAIVWRSLQLPGKPGRIPGPVRNLFLCRLVDTKTAEWKRSLVQVATRAAAAPRAELNAIRDGVVKAWLAGRTWTKQDRQVPLGVRAPAVAQGAPPLPPGEDLEDFAEHVRDAARHARSGVFGDRKVFISAVWRDLGAPPSLEDFKKRLVEANRKGLLRLHRADLVEEMDPGEVAASATRYLDATFHFVERETSP